MSKGQIYSDEFRELIVKMVLDKNKSIVQLAKDLGLSDRTLYNWTHRERIYRKVVKSKEFKNLTEEIAKLKKDLKQIKKERDVLQKIINTHI